MESNSYDFDAADSSDSEESISPSTNKICTDGGSNKRTVRDERTLDQMRQTIADRLQESSQKAAHVTMSREADAEALLDATETTKQRLDIDITLVDLLLHALADTLSDHHAFNATFEDGTHRHYEEQNIGIAVDIDAGLVTPVLTDVGSKSLAAIHEERQELVSRMEAGDYTMSDFQGGTFTVTNLGPLGVDSFTPIINPPEVAILGVGSIKQRPCPDNGDIAFRRQLPLDLSFDHRVVDGADAARFLDTLTEYIEAAESLVSE